MTQTTLADKAQSISRRKAEAGIEGRDYVIANLGTRRSPEKRDLLRTIDAEAKARGAKPRFRANFI